MGLRAFGCSWHTHGNICICICYMQSYLSGICGHVMRLKRQASCCRGYCPIGCGKETMNMCRHVYIVVGGDNCVIGKAVQTEANL